MKYLVEKQELERLYGGTVLEVPMNLSYDSYINLLSFLHAYHELLCHAFDVDDLPVIVESDRLLFPWFQITLDDVKYGVYMRFAEALCDLARRRTRISSKPVIVEDEYVAFICLLVQLLYLGDKKRADREILLANFAEYYYIV